jgi:hypothetical protein
LGSVLLVEETGIPGENHWSVTSHWQTLSHNVVLSTTRFEFATLVIIHVGTDYVAINYHDPSTLLIKYANSFNSWIVINFILNLCTCFVRK